MATSLIEHRHERNYDKDHPDQLPSPLTVAEGGVRARAAPLTKERRRALTGRPSRIGTSHEPTHANSTQDRLVAH